SLVVNGPQSRSQLRADSGNFGRSQRPLPFEAGTKRFSSQEGHSDIAKAVQLPVVVDFDDVVVANGCHGPGLPGKSLGGNRLRRQVRPDDFEGDFSLQLRVAGPVDHTHAAMAKLGQDLVTGEPAPRSW